MNDKSCASDGSIEGLNRTCYCLTLDEEALRRGLEADLDTRGLSSAMVATHPHLFASTPMFVSRQHLERTASVIVAVEAVVAPPHFREAAFASASIPRSRRNAQTAKPVTSSPHTRAWPATCRPSPG